MHDIKKLYIPMSFNSMLNYLHHQMKHHQISSQILGVNKTISNKGNLNFDMDQFIKLFEFDRLPREELELNQIPLFRDPLVL